jgi:peptidoglycan-associated lipoprotein
MSVMTILRAAKIAAVLVAVVGLAACANNPTGQQQAGAAGAAVPGSAQDFVVNVGDRVFFETDSTELTPQARTTLDKQAQWLQYYNKYSFTVEGHADERGTREYNMALGERRANAAKDFLLSQGIPESRLLVTSWGKERPVAAGSNEEAWAQNRRAVTVLVR